MILTLLVIVIGVLLIAGIATYSSASLVKGGADRAAADTRAGDVDVIEPDAAFWTGFAGIAGVVAVAALGAAIVGRAGLLLAVAAFVAILLAGAYLLRTTRQRVRQRVLDAAAGRMAELRARHDAVVERWLAYELDPGKQIDYPQMTDVSQPTAAAVVRAMRQARDARDVADEAAYAVAVTRLEQAFTEAEWRALGQ
ncbi:hypothetical protein V6N00_07500 [Tersicoccus sp. MR15.9]|uniref:hypothetical protein n=1 Tax=Tersicoccus mangrovi TaxID=3121635 RepID=UPI002FE5B5E4